MKKSRFTKTQIVSILKQADVVVLGQGHPPPGWHQRADVLQVEAEVRGPCGARTAIGKDLEAENSRLKRRYAELALDAAR